MLVPAELLGYGGGAGGSELHHRYGNGVVSWSFVPHRQENLQIHLHRQREQTVRHGVGQMTSDPLPDYAA